MTSIKQLVAIAGGTAIVALGTVRTSSVQAIRIHFDEMPPSTNVPNSRSEPNDSSSSSVFSWKFDAPVLLERIALLELEKDRQPEFAFALLDRNNPTQTITRTFANWRDRSLKTSTPEELQQEESQNRDRLNHSLQEYSFYLEYVTQVDVKLPSSSSVSYLDYKRYTAPPKEVTEPSSSLGLFALGALSAGHQLFKKSC